jgi:hypothetical protein
VVDAEHIGEPELMVKVIDDIAVALLPDALGVEGRETPDLAAPVDGVRRGASRGLQGENILVPPDVVAKRMDAEGQVERELDAFSPADCGQLADLPRGQPLGVEVIPFHVLIIVAGPQDPVP